jgi:environmental stress-induced protein Ves
MSCQCITAASVAPQPWRNGGGQTRELLLWPPGTSADDWQLRITLAEVARDGPFSPFPGVQRHFVVVGGCGLSLRWPGDAAWQTLLPGHPPLSFDGGQPPDCRLLRCAFGEASGHSTDLNLMTRRLQGQMVAMQAGVGMHFATAQRGFFAAQAGRWWRGGAAHDSPAQPQSVEAHTLVWQGDSHNPLAPAIWHFEPLHSSVPGEPMGWWLSATPG